MGDRKAFISYASQNLQEAERVYSELCLAPGLRPWLDRKDLVGGSRWEVAIRQAIRNADVFILLLSKSSTTKRGFVQKEIRVALDVLEELPEASVFVIPLRLEDCEVHFEALATIQNIDLFPDWDRGIAQLRRALLVHLGIPENRAVNRSPGVRDRQTASGVALLESTAMVEIESLSSVSYGHGALIGDVGGRITEISSAGTVLRSLEAARDEGGLTALLATHDGHIVMGTGSGRVLSLPSWEVEPTPLTLLGDQIRGLYERQDGSILATVGSQVIVAIDTNHRLSKIECGLPVFAMAAGRNAHEFVVAAAIPGEGGLFHIGESGMRYESLAQVQALALARSPTRPLYALGRPIRGINLLDYGSVPPGDGAQAHGWLLETESVLIYEPIVGEAFDHLLHATNCVTASFSLDGRLVAGGHIAGQVAVWDVETGQEVANIQTDSWVVGLVFMSDGQLLAATKSGIHLFARPRTVRERK